MILAWLSRFKWNFDSLLRYTTSSGEKYMDFLIEVTQISVRNILLWEISEEVIKKTLKHHVVDIST